MSSFDSQGWFAGPVYGSVGMGIGTVTMDYNVPSDEGKEAPKPEAETPLPRPYTLGGYAGQFAGFPNAPLGLTLIVAWKMRNYPMIVKLFAQIAERIMAGHRAYEVTDDGGNPDLAAEIAKRANAELIPMFRKALPGALESLCFGYWLQEIVWGENDLGLTVLDVKSILPGTATIHINEYREFTKYQYAQDTRDKRYAFLCVNDPHFDPILGRSINEAALTTWFRATQSAQNADAIERKASGIQLILHIMEGTTFTDPDTGITITPKQMAQAWMAAASEGKCVVVPAHSFDKLSIANKPELADIPHVKAQLIDHGNQGPNLEAHLNRKRELDVELCSAWGIPERAVMEADKGGIGSSDADSHGDIVLCIAEKHHFRICDQWDGQVSPLWMEANYPGSKVKMALVPSPLSDPQQKFLQAAATALFSNPVTAAKLTSQIDNRKLMERVEMPLLSEADAAKALKDAEDKQAQADAEKAKQLQGMKVVKNQSVDPKKEAA